MARQKEPSAAQQRGERADTDLAGERVGSDYRAKCEGSKVEKTAQAGEGSAAIQDASGFREYIRQRRITKTPSGHFVIDARADRTFPDATTWLELKAYLLSCSAVPAAVTAAHTVWRSYQRLLRCKREAML